MFSASTMRAELLAKVNAYLCNPSKPTLKVLEAGGGAKAHFDYGPHVEVTALDASEAALSRNTFAHKKIIGDLHTVTLPHGAFDLVVCYDVLEHLERPEIVIERLAASVAEGGLLVLASPNPLSFAGILVKLTPHWFHILFYRIFERSQDAGKPGYAPFKTYMRLTIRADAIVQRLHTLGLRALGVAKYETARRQHIKQRSALAGACLDGVLWLGKICTLGRWAPELGDYLLVAQRPALSSSGRPSAI